MAGAGGALCLSGLAPAIAGPKDLAGRLARLVSEPQGARTVAARSRADDRAVARLLAKAAETLPAHVLPRTSDAALRRQIAAWSREDFRHGRVTSVDGWRMSETEIALATLAATRG